MQYRAAYGNVAMTEPANDCATVTQQARVGGASEGHQRARMHRHVFAQAAKPITGAREKPLQRPHQPRRPASRTSDKILINLGGHVTRLRCSGGRGGRRGRRRTEGGREEALAAGARAARARLGVLRRGKGRQKGREEVTRKGGEGVAEGEERGDGRGGKGRHSKGGK